MAEQYVSKINGRLVKDKEARDRLSKLETNAVRVVSTLAEMEEILENATGEDIDSSYMYVGETTTNFKKGGVYKLTTAIKE